MANEYTPDLITLIGDDGKEIEFEILDIIETMMVSFMYSTRSLKIPRML